MNRKPPTARAIVAAALLLVPIGAACSDDDDDAGLRSDTGQQVDQPPADGGDITEDTGDAGTTETDEGTEDDGAAGSASGDVPEDQVLDIEQRHPNGTILRLSQLSFDGNDIFVDVEVINSGDEEITFHDGSDSGSDGLRLVDDAGEEYVFVEPPHEETPFLDDGAIYVAPGETVTGSLAFRGPLLGQPDQIQLVTNVRSEDVPAFNLDEQFEGTGSPEFVVPFDLSWG